MIEKKTWIVLGIVCVGLILWLYTVSQADKDPNDIVGKRGEFLILRSGEEVCGIDAVDVTFMNTDKFVQPDGMFVMSIKYIGDSITFRPLEELTICNEIDDDTGMCINITARLITPCSYCAVITKDYDVIDIGRDCLTQYMKDFLGEIGR